MTTKKGSSTRRIKRPYKSPKLIEYGSVKQFTQVITGTMGMDLGMSPSSRTGGCLTPLPAIEEHRMLVSETACQDKFKNAIFSVVKPGDVVLDLGTGTGLHSFFACQAGAARVYAIDADTIIEKAEVAAIQNGFGDKIKFIRGYSHEVELPEKVDVIITNIGFYGTLKFLANVRDRFLKPNGRLIPSEMQNFFVPADLTSTYSQKVDFWKKPHYGFDLSAFHEAAANHPYYRDFSNENFLSAPMAMDPIDLNAHPLKSLHLVNSCIAQKTGTMNCLVGWYSFKLSENNTMSTEPPMRLTSELWSQHMLPLETPLHVEAGDQIQVEVKMHVAPNIDEPIWTWSVRTERQTVTQTTFKGLAIPAMTQ